VITTNTSMTHRVSNAKHRIAKSVADKTLESTNSTRSVDFQNNNGSVMEMPTDMVPTNKDRSKVDESDFLSLPSIVESTIRAKLNHSTSSTQERNSSSPIHLTDDTRSNSPEYGGKRIIRQRSSYKSSEFGANYVQPPAVVSRDPTTESLHHFSFACKRLSHLMLCIFLYIIFFSSSEVNMHLLRGSTQQNTHENQPGFNNNKFRKKRRSRHKTTSPKQIPVPDFEFESSSKDDSGDDSGDDSPDDGGGAENFILTDNLVGESVQNSLLEDGNAGAKKRLRPTMAHATSIFSPQMEGAPKPKHDQDTAMYSYRDIINDATISSFQNSKLYEDINGQMKKLVSEQNNSPLIYSNHRGENYDSYKNPMIFYGDTKYQIFLCLTWFLLVVFMMDAGVRKMKRCYR